MQTQEHNAGTQKEETWSSGNMLVATLVPKDCEAAAVLCSRWHRHDRSPPPSTPTMHFPDDVRLPSTERRQLTYKLAVKARLHSQVVCCEADIKQ